MDMWTIKILRKVSFYTHATSTLCRLLKPPPLKENLEISERDILKLPASLRKICPQIYCLIRKLFLRVPPPNPLYIREGWGVEPARKKFVNLGSILGLFIHKIFTRFCWRIQNFLGQIKTSPSFKDGLHFLRQEVFYKRQKIQQDL